jgi:hypothetical protein
VNITVVTPVGIVTHRSSTDAFLVRVAGASALAFALPETGVEAIRVDITDTRGRVIWTRLAQLRSGGRESGWDGMVSTGKKAPAGIYHVRVTFLNGGMKPVGKLEKSLAYSP